MTRAKVPGPTQRKALMLLQGILRRAVMRGLIPANPVALVAKPKQPPTQPPRPLAPEVVERIGAQMLAAWSSPRRGAGRSPEALRCWRHRNAMILSMLAHVGCARSRIAARGSRWDDLEGRTLRVVATKTGRARGVDLLAPLVSGSRGMEADVGTAVGQAPRHPDHRR